MERPIRPLRDQLTQPLQSHTRPIRAATMVMAMVTVTDMDPAGQDKSPTSLFFNLTLRFRICKASFKLNQSLFEFQVQSAYNLKISETL
jgi:hypothetical protein